MQQAKAPSELNPRNGQKNEFEVKKNTVKAKGCFDKQIIYHISNIYRQLKYFAYLDYLRMTVAQLSHASLSLWHLPVLVHAGWPTSAYSSLFS